MPKLKRSYWSLYLPAIDLRNTSTEDMKYVWRLITNPWSRLCSDHSAPKGLQRMLIKLQKYNLKVKYKRGDHMFLADTLSRAHLSNVGMCEFAQSLQDVEHTASLAISVDQLQQFMDASTNYPVLQVLQEMIK